MFYGILVMMYFADNTQHHLPHIHVKYQENKAALDVKTGKIIEGKLPRKQLSLVKAWIEIHKDELMADWELAISGSELFKIDPLR